MTDYQPPTHAELIRHAKRFDFPKSEWFQEWAKHGGPIADMRQVEPCDHITVLNSDRGSLSVTDEGLDCCPKCSGTGYVVLAEKGNE